MARLLARSATLWLSIVGGAVVAGRSVAGDVSALLHGEATTPDAVVVGACSAAVVVCCCWAVLATTAVVLEAVGALRPAPGVPAVLRRALLAACGVAITGGLAAPAQATDSDQPGPVAADALHGLALPDRAHGRLAAPVVVRPGDTLWTLAAATLPPDAAAADVDAQWRRLHHVNRGVIGPDPHLIRPGQRLRPVPAPDPTHPQEQ